MECPCPKPKPKPNHINVQDYNSLYPTKSHQRIVLNKLFFIIEMYSLTNYEKIGPFMYEAIHDIVNELYHAGVASNYEFKITTPKPDEKQIFVRISYDNNGIIKWKLFDTTHKIILKHSVCCGNYGNDIHDPDGWLYYFNQELAKINDMFSLKTYV